MFDNETVAAVAAIAARLKVEEKILLAVAEVESGGKVFVMVNGRQEPLIRWEGHYFYARLVNGKRDAAVKAGLASPKAGGVKNPSSQAARWNKLLLPAMKIDATAAFESTSWGLGQVMGAHWKALGFKSPKEMLETVRRDAAGQIEVMARYIEKFGLVDELQRHDFRAFARGYNGPAGVKNGYDKAMSRAYQRLSGAPTVSKATGMLRMGSKGAAVRELQAVLLRAGYTVKVDGDFGPSTKKAVIAFQKAHRIEADGVVGPQTQKALSVVPRYENEQPGKQSLIEVKEVQQGGSAAAGGVGAAAAADKVTDLADKVPATGVDLVDHLVSALYVIAAVLVIAGLAYAALGWFRSKRTETGDEPGVQPAPAAADLTEALA
jgi:hypothetical protein